MIYKIEGKNKRTRPRRDGLLAQWERGSRGRKAHITAAKSYQVQSALTSSRLKHLSLYVLIKPYFHADMPTSVVVVLVLPACVPLRMQHLRRAVSYRPVCAA